MWNNLEHPYNNDMAKNVKLTCNLTGDIRYISEELYEKLVSQYGSAEKLEQYYIKKEISLLIKRGSTILDVSVLHGFEYDKTKEQYYSELIDFHSDDTMVKLERRKESKTHTIETDEEVSEFLNAWKSHLN